MIPGGFLASFKTAWHTDSIARLRNGENIVPKHLLISISDLCNQNCHFCAYRMDNGFNIEQFPQDGRKNPIRFIPTTKCLEIIRDFAELGGKAIEFTGGGEPTVHPDHLQIIEFAQQQGLDTGLVTNGVRLTNHRAFRQLDWLRISLDAGTEATYVATRQSTAWHRVLKNMRLAATFTKPKVGVGFVITKDNAHEIDQACHIVRDCGIPYIRLSAMFSTQGAAYYDNVKVTIPQLDGLQIIDFFHDRLADLDQGPPDYSFCGQQQFSLYLGADQKIYTCCTNAYTKHGEIGDLTTRRFRDWLVETDRRQWNSRSCHHCQFNEKNRLINYLIQPSPEHVNFV